MDSPYLYLADSIRNRDERQDAYLAILDGQPDSEEAARLILSRLHHRTEYSERQSRRHTKGKVLQLNFDPVAPEPDDNDGEAMAALDRLPADLRAVIEEHVIEGVSLRDIAKREGVSKDTIRRRFDQAADRLRQLRNTCAKRPQIPP